MNANSYYFTPQKLYICSMKKALKIIGVIALLLIGFLAYEGLFTSATPVKGIEGGYLLCGVDHIGAYQKIGPKFEQIKKIAEEKGFKDGKYSGVYFDDPKTVAEDKLRSFAGIIVNTEKDSAALSNIPGTHFYRIPKSEAVYCDMPMKGMISMIISISKAYPALGEYHQQHPTNKVPSIFFELYEKSSMRIVMLY